MVLTSKYTIKFTKYDDGELLIRTSSVYEYWKTYYIRTLDEVIFLWVPQTVLADKQVDYLVVSGDFFPVGQNMRHTKAKGVFSFR